MSEQIDSRYPSTELLIQKAKRRTPGFAFDYLAGGCNTEVNLRRNAEELREIQLKPFYTRDYAGASQKVTLYGEEYDAPFGIAPVGLQGLMWPKSCEILAKAAYDHNVPFTLSTVGTADIETISEITHGKLWFQLYHPAEGGDARQVVGACGGRRGEDPDDSGGYADLCLSAQGDQKRVVDSSPDDAEEYLPDVHPSHMVILPVGGGCAGVQDHEALYAERVEYEASGPVYEQDLLGSSQC